MQVTKCCLLRESQDETVREIYAHYHEYNLEYVKKWSGPKELTNLEPIAEHKLRYAGQTGTAGLGSRKSDPYIANPTKKDRRQKITETLISQHEEDHIRHASCLTRQGTWTHWENVMPFDLSWTNLIL